MTLKKDTIISGAELNSINFSKCIGKMNKFIDYDEVKCDNLERYWIFMNPNTKKKIILCDIGNDYYFYICDYENFNQIDSSCKMKVGN